MKKLLLIATLGIAVPASALAANVNVTVNGVIPAPVPVVPVPVVPVPVLAPPPGVPVYVDGGRRYYVERERRVYIDEHPGKHKGWHKQKHKHKGKHKGYDD